MASILKQIGKSTNIPVSYYEADTERDMWEIDVTGVTMGSRCYVINAGAWYALNSDGQWKLIPSGGYDPTTHYIWDGGKADGTWD